MWDTIGSVLTSDNALTVLLTIIVLIIVFAILAKLGIFRLDIKGVTVSTGSDEDERAIIRQQIEWAQLFIQSFRHHSLLVDHDEYHVLYALEKVLDEVISWISFNHISDSETYISIKQEKVWSLLLTLTVNKEFTGDEYKDLAYDCTDKIIRRLVYIRKNYRK